MLFSSLEFLYLFLPLTLTIYFLSPRRARNAVLLTSSLIFYAWGEPKYVFLMLAAITANYLFALLLARHRTRLCLFIAVAFNVLLLFFFKYLAPIGNALGAKSISYIALPIGISFYTFQTISYIVDVYRGDVNAERSIIRLATYISLFPQLIAGPIVKYSDVERSLHKRQYSFSQCAKGILTFSAGLAKKVLLANSAGEMFDRICSYGIDSLSVLSAWLGLLFYAMQIYFDFSGYSDMACGLGRILGFDFPENFNYPYISTSITEFWRRWHITLSSFFRDYVYIPLGGNRQGKARMILNLFIVWSLTGLWHGASINFLLWGIYYFLLLLIEKLFLGKLLLRLPRPIRHIYSMTAVLIGWLIFTADAQGLGISGALNYLVSLFGCAATPFVDKIALYELTRNIVLLFILIIGATPLPRMLYLKITEKHKATLPCAYILSILAIFLSSAYLVSSGYNPFLYFRF